MLSVVKQVKSERALGIFSIRSGPIWSLFFYGKLGLGTFYSSPKVGDKEAKKKEEDKWLILH
jgi:hypothetical protein